MKEHGRIQKGRRQAFVMWTGSTLLKHSAVHTPLETVSVLAGSTWSTSFSEWGLGSESVLPSFRVSSRNESLKWVWSYIQWLYTWHRHIQKCSHYWPCKTLWKARDVEVYQIRNNMRKQLRTLLSSYIQVCTLQWSLTKESLYIPWTRFPSFTSHYKTVIAKRSLCHSPRAFEMRGCGTSVSRGGTKA